MLFALHFACDLPNLLASEDPSDNKIHRSNCKIQMYNHKIQLDPNGKFLLWSRLYDLGCEP